MTNQIDLQTQSQLVRQDAPHMWEVKIPNHPNGVPQMHCGNRRDAERLLELYPDATISKLYLPHPPQTVDVSSVTMAPDPQLSEQKILPESELQPITL